MHKHYTAYCLRICILLQYRNLNPIHTKHIDAISIPNIVVNYHTVYKF